MCRVLDVSTSGFFALQTRQVLGYSLSDRRPDERVLNALCNACHQETPSRGTLSHSDRGGQYAPMMSARPSTHSAWWPP